MRRLGWLALGVSLCAAALPAAARHHASHGNAGDFDYYVMSLSWSPQHCDSPSGKDDAQQCGMGRRYGFVLHGLWPQYERGFPDSCGETRRVPDDVVDAMLPIMPSTRLIQHEWEKHGTCSGLDVHTYFSTARHAFERIVVPAVYRDPSDARRVLPQQIEREFVRANPRLRPDAVTVLCNGHFLQEVRICLDRELAPRRCGTDVRDRCRGGEVIIPPVR